MLNKEQRMKVMEVLKGFTHKPLSTARLRKLVGGMTSEDNSALRSFLNRQVRNGSVIRTGSRRFYWQYNEVTSGKGNANMPATMSKINVDDVKAALASEMVSFVFNNTYDVRTKIARIDGMRYDETTKTWYTNSMTALLEMLEEFDEMPCMAVPAIVGGRPLSNPFKNSATPQVNVRELLTQQTKGKAKTAPVLPGIPSRELQQLMVSIDKLTTTVEQQQKEIEKLRAAQPTQIVIKNPKTKKVKVVLEERVHPIFEQVLFHVNCGDNVMLVGPKGCGKTTLASQVATSLGVTFGLQSLSGGVTETKLLGRSVPNITNGENKFHFAPFARLFRDGNSLFLLDEIDGGDPNVLLGLNSALANKILSIDTGNEEESIIKRGENMTIMAAANTWGTGANRRYAGRNQQDSAFVERFVQIEMGYDRDMELALCVSQTDMVERMHRYRSAMEDNRIERELSTRFLVRATQWMDEGKDINYVEQILFGGWRQDEIDKVKKGH